MSKYTTGEIAKLCGVSVRTVQYYDTRGILAPSELTEGGRRLYSEDLFLGAAFCTICDWGRNEPNRDYPVGDVDTIRAGAGNGQLRNICATPAP